MVSVSLSCPRPRPWCWLSIAAMAWAGCNLADPVGEGDGTEGPTDVAADVRSESDRRDTTDGKSAIDIDTGRDVSSTDDVPADAPEMAEPEACGGTERCNGVDDDCDQTVDEGCPCKLPNDRGVCRDAAIGEDGECRPPETFEEPEVERCADGLDNDCDGEVDEATRPATESCSSDCACLSGRCSGGACAHRIFVTSERSDGDFGGMSGAHEFCREAARDAGLGGIWRAILSTDTASARDMVAVESLVVDLEGARVADDAEFWTSNHAVEIQTTERGTRIGCEGCFTDSVWTATTTDGSAAAPSCSNWTNGTSSVLGRTGDAGDSGPSWIEETAPSNPYECSRRARLYCIDGQRR